MRFPTMPADGLRRPIVPVHVLAPDGQQLIVDALVDTGSDIALFPLAVAEAIGLDLSAVPETPINSALGTVASYRLFELVLQFRSVPEVFRWKATVGFVARRMAYGILGTKGFFEFFTITYNARSHVLDLHPSGALPQ